MLGSTALFEAENFRLLKAEVFDEPKVDWQHSTEDLRDRYLEETDHQDRTRLHALWLVRKRRPSGKLRTISDGVRWAREEARVEYTYWGMRHVFDRLDLEKKAPREQSPDADPEEQEAWKKGD